MPFMNKQLQDVIYDAFGEASMSSDYKSSSEVFEDAEAVEIGNRIINYLKSNPSLLFDDNKDAEELLKVNNVSIPEYGVRGKHDLKMHKVIAFEDALKAMQEFAAIEAGKEKLKYEQLEKQINVLLGDAKSQNNSDNDSLIQSLHLQMEVKDKEIDKLNSLINDFERIRAEDVQKAIDQQNSLQEEIAVLKEELEILRDTYY
jgi:cell division septum initiation protein DivIVA